MKRKVYLLKYKVTGMQTNLRMAILFGVSAVLGMTGCHAPQASNLIPNYDGARLYRENCASCHGKNGTGDGPMVPHLNARPTNLRSLSARNGGTFPYLTVVRQIDGRDLRAVHGSTEMPVWGWRFRHRSNDMPDPTKQTQARIDALVDYLATLQD